MPEQLTLQAAPLQPTRILQEPLPVQLTFVVAVAVLDTVEAQALHEMGFAHVSVSASPAQRMVLVQEPAPTQSMAHELALWQSICPVHVPVPAPVQATRPRSC